MNVLPPTHRHTELYQQAFWLFIVLWCLGQLQRFDIPFRSLTIPLYVHDLFIFFWLATRMAECSAIAINRIHRLLSVRLFSLFLGWVVLGVTIHQLSFFMSEGSLDILQLGYLARFGMYLLFGLSLAHTFTTPLEKIVLRERLISAGFVLLILGLLQYTFIPDTRFLQAMGWDDHYYRLIGSFFDPGFTGAAFVFVWTLVFSLKWLHEKKWWSIALHSVLAVGIALTYSRASYLAFAITLITLFITTLANKKMNKQVHTIILASILGFVLTLSLAPKPFGEGIDLRRTSTIVARKDSATRILPETTIGWILGEGLFSSTKPKAGDFKRLTPDHARMSDNIWLTILFGVGVVGLLLAVPLIIKGISFLWKSDPWFTIALGSMIIHAQFNNTLLEPFILLLMVMGGATILSGSKHYLEN